MGTTVSTTTTGDIPQLVLVVIRDIVAIAQICNSATCRLWIRMQLAVPEDTRCRWAWVGMAMGDTRRSVARRTMRGHKPTGH